MTHSDPLPLAIEPIARAIHGEYLSLVSVDPGKGPSAVPWEELPEEFREANRNQARDIMTKLFSLGLGIVPLAPDIPPAKTPFTEDQVELLSRMEHDRWSAEKVRNGWVYGPVRNNEQKVHPDLVPWEDLDEPAREKDRNPVRAIPRLLAAVGFKIVPLP